MELPAPNHDLQLLTDLLLERQDVAAEIALACLRATKPQPVRTERKSVTPTATRIQLKPAELEVIRWAAAGKSYHDIATIMAIPYGTVRYHLDNARRRNGSESMVGLIVRAACDFNLSPLAG